MNELLVRRRVLAALVVASWATALFAPQGASVASSALPLRICVDQYGVSTDLNLARVRVEQLVRSNVIPHPQFAVARFDANNWSVTTGCPQAPTLLASGGRHPKAGGHATLAGLTTAPSGYRAFIFVVPQSDIDRMFGTLNFHVATQELTCDRGACGSISSAYYVSPEMLLVTDRAEVVARVARGLVQSVGLEAPQLPNGANVGKGK